MQRIADDLLNDTLGAASSPVWEAGHMDAGELIDVGDVTLRRCSRSTSSGTPAG